MSLDVTAIESTASNFPSALRIRDGTPLFPCLWALGNLAILQRRLLGFFCSTRCPGEMILQTYDLARALRDAGVTVISGFHSPMEKECLALLLRGTQPVIVCPARSLERMRLPTVWKAPLAQGRLLIVSPFAGKQHRITADLARKRNEFVATLADEVFVAYAAPGSKTERFCHDVLAWGKPLLTLESDENAHLLTLGARSVRPENIGEQWATNSKVALF
jgi:predicted Rossmann fold nucleotide-binding protein DprA/Smf involved in DNA uptake